MPETYAFASDNIAGVCPEALAALASANAGYAPGYGEDAWTQAARRRFAAVFETACDVFFVFNGTAANALALSAICQPHHAVICHESSHVDTDECGAPEFFTGGAKVLPVRASGSKLTPEAIEPVFHRGHGVHFSKLRAISVTQATEHGALYTPEELRALADVAHARGLAVHMDGARFANAVAAGRHRGFTAADLTWRAGVDALSFGGTKNGLLTTEAIVFFKPELAREFEYRVKQAGQLASKMRFAAAQWDAVLQHDIWLKHAEHANAMAAQLAEGFRRLGFSLCVPVEANGVFVELPHRVAESLRAAGWRFYPFIGASGYRFMCSWATQDAEVRAVLAATRNALDSAAAQSDI